MEQLDSPTRSDSAAEADDRAEAQEVNEFASGWSTGGSWDSNPLPPDVEYEGKHSNTAEVLEPHNGALYHIQNVSFSNTNRVKWYCEVTTPNEIYRISTRPDDFVGTVRESEWTAQTKLAWEMYNVRKGREPADPYPSSIVDTTDANEILAHFRIKVASFEFGTTTAWLRMAVLRIWPCAFAMHGGTANHYLAARIAYEQAETTRKQAKIYYDLLPPNLNIPAPAWLTQRLDIDALCKPVYAMSPDQYERFRKATNGRKDEARAKVLDPLQWDHRAAMYPEIHRPYLPALKAGLHVPSYPNAAAQRAMEITEDTTEDIALMQLGINPDRI